MTLIDWRRKVGPWSKEPDELKFETEAGFQGWARRGALGGWCGYVGIPKTHPLYKTTYQDAPDFEVHGGLTFSGDWGTDLWWLGFDTAHCYDRVPGMQPFSPKAKYRTLEYVKHEIERLAHQVAQLRRKDE